MLNKFRGSMIGGLVGDCLGAPFEFKYQENLVPTKKIVTFLEDVKNLEEENQRAPDDQFQYTDDTAMARQIAITFVEKKSLDPAELARNFTKEYFREQWRGYGGSVVEVFDKLRRSNFSDPFKPASEQFDGSGSYGNGAGMRAHSIGLVCCTQSETETVRTAESVARLTHSHHLGVTGGVLQTLAVHQALHSLKPRDSLTRIRSLCSEREKEMEGDTLFRHKLEVLERFLSTDGDVDHQDVAFELGNGVSAVDSVPTALYCCLSVLDNAKYSQEEKFEAVLKLAIRMGGDTDTIASMACAIAGAHLGLDSIPPHLYSVCEGYREMIDLADKMYLTVFPEAGEDLNTGDKPSPKRTKLS